MTCDEVLNHVLLGETSLPEIKDHIVSCPACSSAAAVTADLSARGRQSRETGLDPSASARISRLARDLMKGRPMADSPLRPWTSLPVWRLAAGTCLLAFLLGAALMMQPDRPEVRSSIQLAGTGTGGRGLSYDSEIDRLRNSLDSRLRRFENRYVADARRRDFGWRSAALKDRIAFHMARVQDEW